MPNIIEGIQKLGSRAANAAKNTRVEWNNPFDDGKGGVNISVGDVGVGIAIDEDKTGGTGKISVSAQRGKNRASLDFEASKLELQLEGSINVSRDGLGSARIGFEFDPKKGKINPLPGVSVKNADGRTVATTDPFEFAAEGIRSLQDILEVDANKATNRAYEDYANRNRKPPQPGSRSRDSILRPSGAQPGTSSRKPTSQPISQPANQPRSPSLPGGTAQTIPKFPTQGSGETTSPGGSSRQQSSSGRLAPEPFQIPQDVPRTNSRLPNKPQIGGSRPSSRSQSGGKSLGGSGGMALGPGNGNNQNPSSGGKRIVRPEDLEDLSPNSPTNKPRINQPTQNNEPRTPKRMLSPQEIGLFNCLNNDGGEACYKKFNQQKPSQNSGGSGSANIELEFGDPYIGMTG